MGEDTNIADVPLLLQLLEDAANATALQFPSGNPTANLLVEKLTSVSEKAPCPCWSSEELATLLDPTSTAPNFCAFKGDTGAVVLLTKASVPSKLEASDVVGAPHICSFDDEPNLIFRSIVISEEDFNACLPDVLAQCPEL